MERFQLTTHAIKRFQERVRPGLAWEAAEQELTRLVGLAEQSAVGPAWLGDRDRFIDQRMLVLGDLVMPLAPSIDKPDHWFVLTCLTRGGIGDAGRAARNAQRRRPDRSRSRRRDPAIRRARLEVGARFQWPPPSDRTPSTSLS